MKRPLAENIRTMRQRRRLKQADLANALQISPQAVSKWEKGANAPDIFLLVKLAALFGVTTDFLLGANDVKQGIFKATVFSSSLRGFAKESALNDAKRMAERANTAFLGITDAVLRAGGIPVKYTGDGFLAFFSDLKHADRAVDAAIDARRTVRDGSLVIVLNSGDIYFGSIGHPDYATRDICGDTVNLAFLLSRWVSENFKGGIGLADGTTRLLEKKRQLGPRRKVRVPSLRSEAFVSELKTN